jgi:hypothetical protein
MNNIEKLEKISELISILDSVKPVLRGQFKEEFTRFFSKSKEFIDLQNSMPEAAFKKQESAYFERGYNILRRVFQARPLTTHLKDLGYDLSEWQDGIEPLGKDIDSNDIKTATEYLSEIVLNAKQLTTSQKIDLSDPIKKDEYFSEVINYISTKYNFESEKLEARKTIERIKTQSELLEKDSKRLAKEISEILNQAKSNLDTEQRKILNKSLSSIEQDYRKRLDQFSDERILTIENNEKKSEDLLSAISEKLNKSEKIYSLLSQELTKEHYGQASLYERKQKDTWRTATLLLFLLTVTGLFGLAYTATDLDDFFLRKIPFAFISLLAIGYCSRQASRHHSAEKFFQQMQFEFLTLDSYLTGLTDEDAKSVKKDLSSRFFGNASTDARHDTPSAGEHISLKDAWDFIKDKIKP